MRKLKDALRLKFEGGLSHQQIATALGISKGVVTKYVGLAVAAGLDAAVIASMDEGALERRLLASPRPSGSYAQADFGQMHQELGRKAVTLMLLWDEYCAQASDEHSAGNGAKPWSYSQFCENYRQFARKDWALPRGRSSRSSSGKAKPFSLTGAPSTHLLAGSGGASSWRTPSCAPAVPSGWWPTPGKATKCCLTHTPYAQIWR